MGFLNSLGILAAETMLSFLGPLCISSALLFTLRQVPQRDLAPLCTFGWVCTSNAGQFLLDLRKSVALSVKNRSLFFFYHFKLTVNIDIYGGFMRRLDVVIH